MRQGGCDEGFSFLCGFFQPNGCSEQSHGPTHYFPPTFTTVNTARMNGWIRKPVGSILIDWEASKVQDEIKKVNTIEFLIKGVVALKEYYKCGKRNMTLDQLGAWINGPGKKLPVLKAGGYLHQLSETNLEGSVQAWRRSKLHVHIAYMCVRICYFDTTFLFNF